ncbi:hypothetical protein BCR33DRAFT_13737 [Rhizoclosmatium globosum]|uniref:Uncharacterized protein n=1 Tax=Rhizoclosmatium globosum TaxID=329046 RepID=A0A1Y2CPN5_9FUNG|nr:hypothetical protein BCR33DRAFT_13737 [Rhizoclosmatium globosum]|eukprot:ORY48906.1 hypothetical protein BCR33DRAFT_13737 [Rhizoclosmatium globosum]
MCEIHVASLHRRPTSINSARSTGCAPCSCRQKNITLKSVYETDGFDKWSTCRIHPTLRPLLERLSPLLHYFRLQLKNLIGDAAYRVLEIVENVRFTNLYHPSNPHFCCSVMKFLDNFGIR